MSTWYNATKEDLSIDSDWKELDVCFTSDYSGAIYVSVPIKDILEIIAEHIQETTQALSRRKTLEQLYREHPEKRPK